MDWAGGDIGDGARDWEPVQSRNRPPLINLTDDASENYDTPEERAQAAWTAFSEGFDGDPDPKEQATLLLDYCDELAQAEAAGLDELTVDAYREQAAEMASVFKKPKVEETYEAAFESIAEAHDDVAPRLDSYLESALEQVVVTRSTDHDVDTSYQWHISHGDDLVVFQTSGGGHWDWSLFREQFFDATGADLREPQRKEAEDWREFLVEHIDRFGVEREHEGPRTEAVAELASYIRSTAAYPEVRQANAQRALYMEEGGADAVLVLSSDVQRICSDRDVTTRGLQEELYARGHTVGGKGVAVEKNDAGTSVKWWKVSTDLATPAEFREDAPSPSERVRDRLGKDEDADSDDGHGSRGGGR